MSALLWLAAAIVLVVAEMFGGELVLLMLAGGALAAAGVDFVWEPPLWVDGLVFAAVSMLLLVAVRPVAKRHMLNRPSVLMNTEALEGQPAVVTETVDGDDGRVKIGGDIWSARSVDPAQVLEPGTHVTVVEIDGATAVVWHV
ncbi:MULTISPECIES: NfeD family protein [Gordonia]|jgi:membrane protein implicated in regulation of membrane protease activity|uniref:Membrane protein n=1 Tax=Gordonia alkanivorans CGMCC 6845 TaxID=1423140 RepID=W9DDH9_9ACTN|nr:MULTISPECIES: NfeD family protein [Gordonia]AZZ82188.1 NfeD family protein [Gordonia alkanivorans]ETA06444.1 membrane protein [Gordonia alkanivorans CGMCC 6845]MDH3006643.1 NfeD family protein [Gordonia alkanivorans]MDH3009958.1 NfeD family protein [Gordonia alkanivorans]MDH3014402.1 NfeD family protein [Gordonia alkanivorans]